MSTPTRSSLVFLASVLAMSTLACQCGSGRTPSARTSRPAAAPAAAAPAAAAAAAAARPAAPNAPVAAVPPGEPSAAPAANLPRALPAPIPPPADVAAPPADAERSRTGLVSRRLVAGQGTEHPRAGDTVQLHYTGWTSRGVMFDSSLGVPTPIEFVLGQGSRGATEWVQLMVAGEKRRFWMTPALAAGGAPALPSGTLVYDVELIAIAPRSRPQ